MTKAELEKMNKAIYHHSTLNAFAAVVGILEGGLVYDPDAYKAAQHIIKIAKAEQLRQVIKHDRLVASLKKDIK